jgi:hypothetical protein
VFVSDSSGQGMAGRGGGGKGAAGRMMSLQEFVSCMQPLIDLEKVSLSLISSLRLTRVVTASWVGAQAAEISAESETSAKSLERRGCVIANLKCTDAQVAASVIIYFCCCLCCLM